MSDSIDMNETIIAKSDQLNADDLIGRPLTIQITDVKLKKGSDQPITINYVGDNGKPYKPSKGMRRVLVLVWGDEGRDYIGRSMTLYRDETVKWAGAPVGGIQISHMSNLTEPFNLSLTVSRGVKKPYTVHPLKVQKPAPPAAEQQAADPNDPRTIATKIGVMIQKAADAGTLSAGWQEYVFDGDLEKVKQASQIAYDDLLKRYNDKMKTFDATA